MAEVDSEFETDSPLELPWWRKLGPDLITGAADDDPSGIAAYFQGGAQYGFDVAWTVLVIYPLMVGIQQASARIGRITGRAPLREAMNMNQNDFSISGLLLSFVGCSHPCWRSVIFLLSAKLVLGTLVPPPY